MYECRLCLLKDILDDFLRSREEGSPTSRAAAMRKSEATLWRLVHACAGVCVCVRVCVCVCGGFDGVITRLHAS